MHTVCAVDDSVFQTHGAARLCTGNTAAHFSATPNPDVDALVHLEQLSRALGSTWLLETVCACICVCACVCMCVCACVYMSSLCVLVCMYSYVFLVWSCVFGYSPVFPRLTLHLCIFLSLLIFNYACTTLQAFGNLAQLSTPQHLERLACFAGNLLTTHSVAAVYHSAGELNRVCLVHHRGMMKQELFFCSPYAVPKC